MPNDCGCGFSILSKQPSLIPSPLCAPDCPVDLGCTDTLPTKCSIWNGGNIPSIGIVNGDTLNDVITQLIINSGAGSVSGCCLPLVWNNITLNEGYSTLNTFQAPQYAVDPANGKVYLRGTIQGNGQGPSNSLFSTLPVVPLFNRRYLAVFTNYSGTLTALDFSIGTGGQMVVNFPDSNTPSVMTITLDSLSFETN